MLHPRDGAAREIIPRAARAASQALFFSLDRDRLLPARRTRVVSSVCAVFAPLGRPLGFGRLALAMRSCSAARARSASAAGPRPEHPRTARPFFLARSAPCLWKVPRPSDASRIGAYFDWKNSGVARSVASAAPRVRLGRPFAGASADLPRVAALGLDAEASSDSEDLDSGSDMSDVEEIIEVSEDELDPSERMLVVLTREDGKNADMQALLEQFGIDSLVLPLIRTEELPAALDLPAAVRGLPSGSWICLTSAIAALTLCAHALEPLAERWAREELRVAVVGVATGRALEQHSGGRVIADFVPTIANARTMGAELPLYDAPARSEGSEKDAPAASESSGGMSGEAGNKNLEGATSSSSGRRECSSDSASTLPGFSSESAPESAPHVLFPASRLALGLLERILEERGAVVRRMEVYGTVPQVVDDPELVQRASIADAVVLASPSAAKCVATREGNKCRQRWGRKGRAMTLPRKCTLAFPSHTLPFRISFLLAGHGSQPWGQTPLCECRPPASARRRRKPRGKPASAWSSPRTSPARAQSWSSSSEACQVQARQCRGIVRPRKAPKFRKRRARAIMRVRPASRAPPASFCPRSGRGTWSRTTECWCTLRRWICTFRANPSTKRHRSCHLFFCFFLLLVPPSPLRCPTPMMLVFSNRFRRFVFGLRSRAASASV